MHILLMLLNYACFNSYTYIALFYFLPLLPRSSDRLVSDTSSDLLLHSSYSYRYHTLPL